MCLYELRENSLSADTYLALRRAVGWDRVICEAQCALALECSLATVEAVDGR